MARFLLSIFFLIFLAISAPAHAKRLNVQDELSYRVEFGGPKDVKMLLEKGGNPNGVNDLGWPLVSVAARRTDGLSVQIVDMLVKAGADINQGGPSRQFPIIIAARNGDAALAQYLLEQGADSGVRDRNGVEPVEIAKYYGHDNVFDILEDLALQRAEAQARRTSPERLQELRGDLVKHACASQYMAYYFQSGMDSKRFSQQEIDEEMNARHTDMSTSINDLYQIFKVDMNDITAMREYGATEIYNELEAMISPRNRRKLGVGKLKDREKRCQEITDRWIEIDLAAQEKAKKEEELKKLRKGDGAGVMVR